MSALEELQNHIHGIQALRRRVERLRSPYQGATGVRAQFYPHQLQTVLRILRDTQVRHLIADEVGLGKTVQALMVLNALRLQRGGKFRTIVVVPQEQHARQWADEVWRRVHTTAYIDDDQPTGDDWVQILWTAKINSPGELLDPARCDLLILDEIQSLRSDVLSTVARRARAFQHVLVLTATPDLRSAQSLCQLLQLIEPDRVELAHRQIAPAQSGMPSTVDVEAATEDVNSDLGEAVAIAPDIQEDVLARMRDMRQKCPESAPKRFDLSALSATQLTRLYDKAWWMFRRVIRSRRNDYPNHLPRREQDICVVEPLASDEQRYALMRKYLNGFLQRENDKDRAALIARRAIVGGVALRERIGELQRQDRDPNGELEAVKLLCRPECGNSRLDELTDWLAELWCKDPHKKVLIAAQDNPTIQFLEQQLAARLPDVGSRGKREELSIVTLLAESDHSEHGLIDAYLNAQKSIAPFESGCAQLAIAHEDYREAYNFQSADVLVFYNIPWTPEHVDQWIGRVDRLGRETIDPNRPTARPLPVQIVAIGQQGQIDQRMIEVYETSGVFERPLQLDREEASRIALEIEEAGLGLRESNWELLQAELGARYKQHESLALDQPAALGTPELAADLYDQLRSEHPVEPVMNCARPLGYVSSDLEAALAQWLRVLGQQDYYLFHSNRDEENPKDQSRRFYTISQSRSRSQGRLDRLDQLQMPQWAPFFLARKHIQRPPRRYVLLRSEQAGCFPRTLEFLDHGSPLHEELVMKWIDVGRQANVNHKHQLQSFVLHLSNDCLPKDTSVSVGRFLIAVGYADPAAALETKPLQIDLLGDLETAPNQSQANARDRELRQLQTDIEADIRFIRSNVATQLPVVGKKAGGTEEINDKQLLYDLIAPVWSTDNHPFCEHRELQPEVVEKQLPTLLLWFEDHLNAEVEKQWRESRLSFRQSVRERLLIIEIESEDRIADLQAQLDEVTASIREFERWPSERNDRVIQLSFRPKQNRVTEQIALSRRRCEIRHKYFHEVLESLLTPQAQLYQCLDLYIEMITPSEMPTSDGEQSKA